MSRPLLPFLAAQGLAGDFGDDEYGAFLPFQLARGAARGAGRAMRRRRAQRCQQFAHPMAGPPVVQRPGGDDEYGYFGDDEYGADEYGADDTDYADDAEMAAEEDEIAALEGDDDDYGGDEPEEIGASIAHLDRRIEKLTAQLARLEGKLAATPQRRFRKRRRLLKAIARVKHAIAKKEAKKERKVAKVAAKLGVPAAALMGAGAGVAAGYGISRAAVGRTEAAIDRAAAERALGISGETMRSPYMGQEIRIPFTDKSTGSPVMTISVAAGAGLRTADIEMVTQALTYADFEIVGIDTDLKVKNADAQGAALHDALVNLLLQSVIVGGGYNLLYQTENVAFGAQTTNGTLSVARTIPGLRGNVKMEANNTATLLGTFRQEITNLATITATFQAALVCRVLRDDVARRLAS